MEEHKDREQEDQEEQDEGTEILDVIRKEEALFTTRGDNFLLQLWEDEDELKDVSLKISFMDNEEEPESKRPRRAASSPSPQKSKPQTLKAHSVVLRTRSLFFREALRKKEFKKTKTLMIELESRKEYESFEELIRRSYGTSFLHMPDEEPLSYQALLLLLKLSYKVKFLGCEDECSQELLNHITAQTCGEIVGVVEAWDEPCPSTAHLLQVAMDKLISALSPLESLWQQGKFCLGNSEDAILPSNAPLSTPAKMISSVDTLIAVLRSERLGLLDEGTTFNLVEWWIDTNVGWPEKESTMKAIIDSGVLRFHCMSPATLSLVVTTSPLIKSSKTALRILQQSSVLGLGIRSAPEAVFDEATSRHQSAASGAVLKSRADPVVKDGWEQYIFQAIISKDECMKVEEGQEMYCMMGVARGFPIVLCVERHLEEEGNTLGLYVGWQTKNKVSSGQQEEEVCPVGIYMRPMMEVQPAGSRWTSGPPSWVARDDMFGTRDLLGCTWDELMADNSPYFNDQDHTMTIRLTVDLIMDPQYCPTTFPSTSTWGSGEDDESTKQLRG